MSAVSDRIRSITLSSVALPLPTGISDAKVSTGRQRPMTEVALLFAEIRTEGGLEGVGFSYSKRAGGPAQFAHAREVAPDLIGEDPNDIGRLWTKLVWAGASVGRSGAATQALAAFDVALWDVKAKRADLPLAKLLGAHRDSVRCYDTSGGFLHETVGRIKDNATRALESGVGGIKIKVGLPDRAQDLRRVAAVREHLGDGVPLMVDANQQWDRPTAMRVGRALEEFDLVWIEEPLDAYDVEGHAELTRALTTAVASGEMLTSVGEHYELIRAGAVDVLQPDAPRVGGITSSSSSPRSPTTTTSSSRPTSPWRSTSTSPPPTRASRGSSTSTGCTRCSRSGWRPATAGCTCPTDPASASRSPTRPAPGPSRPRRSAHPGDGRPRANAVRAGFRDPPRGTSSGAGTAPACRRTRPSRGTRPAGRSRSAARPRRP